MSIDLFHLNFNGLATKLHNLPSFIITALEIALLTALEIALLMSLKYDLVYEWIFEGVDEVIKSSDFWPVMT